MTEQLYTTSRLRVLRDCIRRHHYQYRLGIRTPSTYVMQFGTALHAALEAYLNAWKANPDLRVVDGEQIDERLEDAILTVNATRFSAFEQAKLRALVVAYHLRWGNENWEVLAVEQEFRYELDGNLIGGKMDGLIRDLDTGRVYVLEHKSTATDVTPGSPYWEKLAIDSQVSIYIDGAAMLGHEIAGCIYDVIKRPEHEQLLATPIEKRKYTLGKGCKKCGGSAGGEQGIVRGKGMVTITFVTTDTVECDECDGTGWKKDSDGNPQEPRLRSNQRDRDETIDEYQDRVASVIGERPDDFLIRNIIVRLDDELPRQRESLLDAIKLERVTSAVGLFVPNTDACARYGAMCPFFSACSGRVDIEDESIFPRSASAHPELAQAA